MRCAGLQVDLPSHTGPMAYAAALIGQGPPLRAAIREWRLLAPDCPLPTGELDGTAAAERGGLLEELAQRGIHLGGCGKPAGSAAERAADPLRPSVPEQHLLSQYLRASASAAFDTLMVLGSDRDKARLRSASGPNAGAIYSADLAIPGVGLADASGPTLPNGDWGSSRPPRGTPAAT